MKIEPLSNRETEILKHFCNTNMQIAEKMKLSYYTVNTHVYNIDSKLGASSKLEALGLALKIGILEPKDLKIYFMEKE